MKEQSNALLEEIKEEDVDFENKRGKSCLHIFNTAIFVESTYFITKKIGESVEP